MKGKKIALKYGTFTADRLKYKKLYRKGGNVLSRIISTFWADERRQTSFGETLVDGTELDEGFTKKNQNKKYTEEAIKQDCESKAFIRLAEK